MTCWRRWENKWKNLAVFIFLVTFIQMVIFTWTQNQTQEIEEVTPQEALDILYKHEVIDGNLVVPEHITKYVPKITVSDLNCTSLFLGEGDAIEKGKTKRKPLGQGTCTLDQSVLVQAQDCPKFRKNYVTHVLTNEEAAYPIAFSILLYKQAAQTERLLRSIYRPQNIYCLHVDKKSPQILHRTMAAIADCFDNVFVVSKNVDIVYAGISRVYAELNCMNETLQYNSQWQYYINLAGQVMPLRTNAEMVKILKAYNGSNDIEGISKKSLALRYRVHYDTVTKNDSTSYLVKTKTRKSLPPHGLQIIRGSAYGIFSRKFVEFVLSDKRVKDLIDWSNDTYSPDEHIWATLHHLKINKDLDTPGGYYGTPDDKKWLASYSAWHPRDRCETKHFIHYICINGVEDLQRLKTRPEFFANKFLIDFDLNAIDCMEEWLYQRTVYTHNFDMDFYENLAFIKR